MNVKELKKYLEDIPEDFLVEVYIKEKNNSYKIQENKSHIYYSLQFVLLSI